MFAAGWEPGTDPVRWSYGLGLGARFDARRAVLRGRGRAASSRSTRARGTGPRSGWGNLLPTLHAVAGWKVFGPVAVTAGIDVDVYVPGMSRNPDGSAVGASRLAPRLAIGLEL